MTPARALGLARSPCYNGTVTLPAPASCHNHASREAIGICVQCHAQCCGECVTKIDGINYCVACLAKLAGDPKATAPREGVDSFGAFFALTLFITLTAMAWLLVEAAMPGSG